MKKILSTALAVALFIGVAQAQEGSKENHHGKRGDMFKELNLTAEQQAKIKSIREAQKTEMKALKADGKTEAGKEARKTLHEKYKAQMDGVLTTEQKEKLKEGRKNAGSERFSKGGQKEKMHQIGKNLDLSTDQKTKMASINSEFKTKMTAIKSNTALSQEQKKEQFHQLAAAHQANFKSLLTKEQLAKMEEARKSYKNKKNRNV